MVPVAPDRMIMINQIQGAFCIGAPAKNNILSHLASMFRDCCECLKVTF